MLRNVIAATLRLILFRAGPQDFPFDPNLTRALVPAAALANYLVLVTVLPPAIAVVMSLAVVSALGFSTHLVLRARGVQARFMQTYHALLAVATVMTLALWPPFSVIAPALIELSSNPEALEDGSNLDLPAGPAFLMNALNVWNFMVNASIFRHAANLNLGLGVVVALVVAFGVLMFVVFFAAIATAILGAPGAAG